jgi:hypothetical protein
MSKCRDNNQLGLGREKQKAPFPKDDPPFPPYPSVGDWREGGYAEEEDSEFLGLAYWHVSDQRRKAGIPRGRIVLLPDEVTELCKRAAESREAARAYALDHRHAPRAKLGKTPQTPIIKGVTGFSSGSFPAR